MEPAPKSREYPPLLTGSLIFLVLLPGIFYFLSYYFSYILLHLMYISLGIGAGIWTWLACRFSLSRLLPVLIVFPLGMMISRAAAGCLAIAAYIPLDSFDFIPFLRYVWNLLLIALLEFLPMAAALWLYRPLFRLSRQPFPTFLLGTFFLLLAEGISRTIVAFLTNMQQSLFLTIAWQSAILLLPAIAGYFLTGFLLKRREPPVPAVTGGYQFHRDL